MVGLAFLPENFGICCYVNVGGVVILLGGGGNTLTLHNVIKVVLTFCGLAWWGHKNLVYTTLVTLAP